MIFKEALRALLFAPILCLSADAATNGVSPTSDVQAAINSAAPGDTLLMEPGAYGGNLVFNKSITIAPMGTAGNGEIQFTGNIKFENSGVCSIQNAFFGGTLESVGGTLTVLDSSHNAPVTAKGGKLILKRVRLEPAARLVVTNGGSLEALRVNAFSSVSTHAPATNRANISITQSYFRDKISIAGANLRFAYNTTSSGPFSSSPSGAGLDVFESDAVIIGNRIYGAGTRLSNNAITVESGKARILNNLVVVPTHNGIAFVSASGDLINNTVSTDGWTLYGTALAGPMNIRGNIVHNRAAGMLLTTDTYSAPQIFLSYCLFWGGDPTKNPQSFVTTPFVGCIFNQDPKLAPDYLTLEAGSPALNAGMEAGVYRNRDQSRNTIGYTGGPYYNPANLTNNNPMVFHLQGPQTIFKNSQTTIPVSAGASAGH